MRAEEYILKFVESFGDKTAQINSETRRSITFHEIRLKCAALKKWLHAENLGRGKVVGLVSENNVDFAWIMLGIWSSGAACQLICPRSTLHEVANILRITPVDCLIMQKGGLDRFACPETLRVNHVIEFGDDDIECSANSVNMDQVLRGFRTCKRDIINELSGSESHVGCKEMPQQKGLSVVPEDVALLMTSSGSTGTPKCVMLTHENVIAYLRQSKRFVTKNSVVLGLMTWRHAWGLYAMLMSLCEGAFVVIKTHFLLSTLINTIRDFAVSHMHIVPSVSMSLLKSDSINFQDLRSLEVIWLAGAPVCDKAHAQLKQKFLQRVRIFKGYGLTEITCVAIVGESDAQKPGCIGRVFESMQCKIIDPETGCSLSSNEIGEFCFKGPMVAKGYMNNKEATEQAFGKDGWFRTGDLGYMDSDGFYYYVDRIKHVFKYQGLQISPCELETVLTTCPGVKEAAVIGVPHKILGEVPRAFIVRQDHSQVSAEELHDYMRDRVAPFKQLRGGIVFLPELPKIGPGKVGKYLLHKLN